MVGTLERVLVCSPGVAGWNSPDRATQWRELGFRHEPNFQVARTQHDALCHELEAAGAEVLCLPASQSFSLDAVYAHDASLPTDSGVILMNPGKTNRLREPAEHRNAYENFRIP